MTDAEEDTPAAAATGDVSPPTAPPAAPPAPDAAAGLPKLCPQCGLAGGTLVDVTGNHWHVVSSRRRAAT
jgi:hypothetical protein